MCVSIRLCSWSSREGGSELKTYASYEEIGLLLSLKHASASPINGKHILVPYGGEEELWFGLGRAPSSKVFELDSNGAEQT